MEEQEVRLVDRFMPEGRLLRLPSKAAKRQVVLEHLAHLFEPGVRYTEKQVDLILLGVCEGGETDHVSVRRYLVDSQLLAREAGEYWRVGGWVAGT
jgi:hypothetical protein